MGIHFGFESVNLLYMNFRPALKTSVVCAGNSNVSLRRFAWHAARYRQSGSNCLERFF
jgi:hypothetical protein